jgi:hypothetical protein
VDNQLSTEAIVWLALVGPIAALLGVLLTSLFNVLNEKGRAKREHLAWLRDKRFQVYSDLMDSWFHDRAHTLYRLKGNRPDDAQWKEWLDASKRGGEAMNRALLISPEATAKELRRLNDEWSDLTSVTHKPKGRPTTAEELRDKMSELRALLRPFMEGPV